MMINEPCQVMCLSVPQWTGVANNRKLRLRVGFPFELVRIDLMPSTTYVATTEYGGFRLYHPNAVIPSVELLLGAQEVTPLTVVDYKIGNYGQPVSFDYSETPLQYLSGELDLGAPFFTCQVACEVAFYIRKLN